MGYVHPQAPYYLKRAGERCAQPCSLVCYGVQGSVSIVPASVSHHFVLISTTGTLEVAGRTLNPTLRNKAGHRWIGPRGDELIRRLGIQYISYGTSLQLRHTLAHHEPGLSRSGSCSRTFTTWIEPLSLDLVLSTIASIYYQRHVMQQGDKLQCTRQQARPQVRHTVEPVGQLQTHVLVEVTACKVDLGVQRSFQRPKSSNIAAKNAWILAL